MLGVNKVILIGNLGKDPEVRTLESGTKVATFSLATNESFKGKDGNRVEQTEWHNIVLWRALADLAEKYLRKGNQIYLEGRIKSRSWEDKEGNRKYITEIVGDNMTFLGKPSESTSPNRPPATEEPQEFGESSAAEEGDGDLPF